MSRNKDNMTPRRWDYIKSLPACNSRYFHESCVAGMRGDPRGAGFPAIPFVRLTGGTYRRPQA